MTVEEYARKTGLEVLAMPAPGREVTGGYCGDLLSLLWAEPGQGMRG